MKCKYALSFVLLFVFLFSFSVVSAQECKQFADTGNVQSAHQAGFPAVYPSGIGDYLVPLLLGFSFGNLWICALLVFSLQTTNRSACAGYLAGRALAILALSIMVALLGKLIHIEKRCLNLFSAVFLIGFAAYLSATQIFRWISPWKKKRVRKQNTQSQTCGSNCTTCPTHGHSEYSEACLSCGDDPRLCAAEEIELEPLSRTARELKGRQIQDSRVTGFLAGSIMGAVRGVALCSKLAVLLPVLMGASISKAIGMGLTFSLSSSIYPLMGFVMGAFALKLVKYKRWLFGISCVMLLIFGSYYAIKGLFDHM